MLSDSEARYRDLFENANDLIQSVSPEGRILYVNPAWLRTLGYEPADLERVTLWDVVHPDHHEDCRGRLERLFAGETLEPFETTFVSKSGRDVFLEANVSCRMEGGRAVATRAIFRDISARRSAEAQIRLQAAALDAAADGIAITDRHGVILWVNAAYTRLTGYSAEDVRGRTHRILKSGAQAASFYEEFWRTILQGKSWRGLLVNRRKDGACYDEEMSVTPLVEETGVVTHFVAIKNDVTQRNQDARVLVARERALSASELRFRTLLAHAPEAILIADPEGRITMANSASEQLLGRSQGELKGLRVDDLLPSRARGTQNAVRREAQGENPTDGVSGSRAEILVQHRDGTEIPVEVSLSFAPAEGGAWGLCHLVDLRPRRAADRAKRDFFAVVSHELRTPLTSIRGSLGLLAGRAGAGLSPEAQSLVGVALSNTERLLRLINDILDFESIERSDALRVRTVDVVAVAAEAVAANGGYADQYGVTLSLRCTCAELWVRADPDRLQQVLANLLSNAAKYSPRGGTVTILVGRSADEAEVAVHNLGPSIPEAFRGRIFERFAQADSTDSRRHGGSGLGLAISKTIIERHGGSIGFATSETEGTTFHFTIPVSGPPGGGPAATECPAATG